MTTIDADYRWRRVVGKRPVHVRPALGGEQVTGVIPETREAVSSGISFLGGAK